MLYTILIYADEGVIGQLPPEDQDAAIGKHMAMQKALAEKGALGPFAKLMGPASAVTVRSQGRDRGDLLVTDGPFAETKEQLLGFYMIECETIDEAVEAVGMLPQGVAVYEIRPAGWTHLDREREQAEQDG